MAKIKKVVVKKKKDPIKKVRKVAKKLGGFSGKAVSAIEKRRRAVAKQMKELEK